IEQAPELYAKGQQQLNQATLAEKGRIFANDISFNAADPVMGALSPFSTIEEQRKATELAREHAPAGFELASGVLGGLASGDGLAKGGLTAVRFAPQARTLAAGAGRAAIAGGEQAALSGPGAYQPGDGWRQVGT